MPQSLRSPYLTGSKRALGAEDKYRVTRKPPAPRHPGGGVSVGTVGHRDGGFGVYLERRETKNARAGERALHLTAFFAQRLVELCLDAINADTMRCVGRSDAGCARGGLLSELIIPRTRNN